MEQLPQGRVPVREQVTLPSDDLLRVAEDSAGRGTALVALSGELDRSNEPQARAAVERALRKGSTWLIIDLESLLFMDSSGLQVLLQAHQALRQRNGTLVLLAPKGLVLRLLTISHLPEMVPVYPSIRQAIADLLPGSDK